MQIPESKVTSSNVLFNQTDSPKPKDIQIGITQRKAENLHIWVAETSHIWRFCIKNYLKWLNQKYIYYITIYNIYTVYILFFCPSTNCFRSTMFHHSCSRSLHWHTGFFTGDKQQGAQSHPMTPHWSVSMVVEVWLTAGFRVRSEGHPHCSLPLCSTLTLIRSSALTDPSIFLIPRCIRSSSSSSSLPLGEEVATSPDKWKLRRASLAISRWTRGCFKGTHQLRGSFPAAWSNLPYQPNHKVQQVNVVPEYLHFSLVLSLLLHHRQEITHLELTWSNKTYSYTWKILSIRRW